MNTLRPRCPVCHPEFSACAEELLFHTSRYYGYTEKFLTQLARPTDFSMAGYDAGKLSAEQRKVLTGLLSERPDREVGRHIATIVSDVIQGVTSVDAGLLQKYQGLSISSKRRYFRHCSGAMAGQQGASVSPVDPIQNIAARLHIPIQVKGRRVLIPLEMLGRHLDSPNPTIRSNIQDAIQTLHAAGYRLVNTPYHPSKKIDWRRHQRRLSLRGISWQLFGRWRQPQREKSYPA